MPKGLPFRYGRRKCIFCKRQPPEVSISKEHLFALWLRELFPRDACTTHTLGVMESATNQEVRELRKNGQGHSGSKKIRHVCQTCNGTWLSNNIEDVAKPIITRLLSANRSSIDAATQKVLATWAAKTVMTAEWVYPNKVVLHQSERNWLKSALAPPIGWTIWIGNYSGITWGELAIQQHAAKLRFTTIDDGDMAEHNFIFTIIGMRRLMIVAVSSSWPRVQEIIDSLGAPHPALLQVWPIVNDEITWPQIFSVTDMDADILAGYYLGKIGATPV